VGGKTLNAYSWQWLAYKWEDPADGFKANTLIHETGHAMGLPDYYDYKPGVGPDGGVGDFDMMDSASYDHNCFSKMLLGWVEPRRISFISQIKLRPAEDNGDCAMLLPAGRSPGQFGEFFLVENRSRSGNDAKAPFLGGLVVWHVDDKRRAVFQALRRLGERFPAALRRRRRRGFFLHVARRRQGQARRPGGAAARPLNGPARRPNPAGFLYN